MKTKTKSGTDWAEVDALTDADIDTSEIPEQGEEFFRRATLLLPRGGGSIQVSVAIDTDTLAWYEAQGEDAERYMVEALRIYAEAHR